MSLMSQEGFLLPTGTLLNLSLALNVFENRSFLEAPKLFYCPCLL